MGAAPVMEHYTRSVGITPDQNGCIVTDEVHSLISDKLLRGYTSGAPSPINRPDTTLSQGYSPKHGRHQAAMMLVPKWCYTI